MAEPLFVSQEKLEEWIERGEVTFQDDVLELKAEGASYTVEPAVRVVAIIDGKDEHGLVGRVLTASEIQRLRAEQLEDSLIVGESAYQCEPGFVGAALERPEEPSAAEPADDMQLLTDFLLKNL